MAGDVVEDFTDDDSTIVTDFFLSTCRLCQLRKNDVYAALVLSSMAIADRFPETRPDYVTNHVPLLTGSVAELWIQPMLSCVGDIDIMRHRSIVLAIPYGYPLPTQLPAEFDSPVEVCEIIDIEYPGYVYLARAYLLTENNDNGRYVMQKDLRPRCSWVYFKYDGIPMTELHGPARILCFLERELSFDFVICVRCLLWPTQAADWPARHRNYGWPDSATLDRVVGIGCDIVGVAHHLCRQDQWKNRHQCRLSFSRAEIILINTWMPIQQIVYHMLRIFVKTEQLIDTSDNAGTKMLCNYHVKTLMLWACELKPETWWIDDMNVVSICAKLLHSWADWLQNKSCPHYFVKNCNLFETALDLEIIASQLMSISESWLSAWFVNNYLRKCARLCPGTVSRLFDDVSTSLKLQKAVSALVDWRMENTPKELWQVCDFAEFQIAVFVSKTAINTRSCDLWIHQLNKLNLHIYVYFTAIAFLHVARRYANECFNEELVDVLATLVGQFIGKQRYFHQLGSVLSLSQAANLMKVVVNNSRNAVQLIETELSKAYLFRALRCKDSESDSIYCLANVYLAVLYYTTGHYQKAIDHCTMVTRSQDHSQCSSHVVQGEIMPKIDDDIDSVLGLAVFYQYVRTAALNQQQQTRHVSIFNTELFAHYLHIRCQSVVKCRRFSQMSSDDEVQRYVKYVVETDDAEAYINTKRLFITDVLLLKSITSWNWIKFQYRRLTDRSESFAIKASELDTSELVELLQRVVVESLTSYLEVRSREFCSVATIVTTVFEALYAYKRGDYQRCLRLSTQNVHALLNADRLAFVPTFPEFVQLLDDDIVSLTALTLIIDPDCRDKSRYVFISQLTLSLYLRTQCQFKLHYSAMSLAETFDYIQVAKKIKPVNWILNQLTLKLSERKLVRRITSVTGVSVIFVEVPHKIRYCP